MHRYIRVIAKWVIFQNWKRLFSIAKTIRKSKFGISRFIRGPLDLLTIMLLVNSANANALFGSIGRFYFDWFCNSRLSGSFKDFYSVFKIADKPIFYLALLCMIIGAQLFIGGFGRMIGRHAG